MEFIRLKDVLLADAFCLCPEVAGVLVVAWSAVALTPFMNVFWKVEERLSFWVWF